MSERVEGLMVQVVALAESPAEGIENSIEIIAQTAPDPSTLRPDEVIMAVRSAGLSWVDLLMTSGQYQHMPNLPYTPGLEYSGDIIAAGRDADAQGWLGKRAFVDCFSVGPRTSGPYQAAGGFASYAVLPSSALRQIPADWSYDEACNFAGNYETAYHCLITRGQLQAGETVLILGASGATGLAAIQVARAVGAQVIAAGRSPEKLATLRELGAHHTICTAGEDRDSVRRFREDAKALTNGVGVDMVYDGVGGRTSLEALRCTRFGARFLIVGWASTPDVAKGRGGRGAPRANQLPTNLMLMKGLDVLGCPAVISAQKDPSLRTERNRVLTRWIEEGLVRPHIAQTYPLENVREALRAKWAGKMLGGCALHIPKRPQA
ncbi:MAG: NADPH:quinone oxidoreductase family protein [Bradymonadia bacterium]